MLGSTMSLNITNIHGQIGISAKNAVLSIRQPKADLQIESAPAELNLHTQQARVIIDQSQCFREAGLKGVLELTRDYAQRGMSAALEGIGKIASQGNRMAAIETGENAVAAIARGEAFPPPAPFNVALMPVSRPKIDVVGGVFLNPKIGGARINIRANRPEIDAAPGSVEVYMQQKPYFHFEFVGKNVDVSA